MYLVFTTNWEHNKKKKKKEKKTTIQVIFETQQQPNTLG